MKQIMAVVMGLALLAGIIEARAQDHISASFLTVQSVTVSNTFGITNLVAAGAQSTNQVGTIYTNNNARVVAAAGNARNLIQDVPLWANRYGGTPVTLLSTNTDSNVYERSDLTISATLRASSGANAALTFVVVPVWDGENAATAAADTWTFAFTPTASAVSTWSTNVPMNRFRGAKSLRLLRVTNGSTAATSDVAITALRLNGFKP